MITVYRAIKQRLQAGESVVLSTVINTLASTPRKAGAKMAIFNDGKNIGSIGGGKIEAAVEELSDELFQSGGAILQNFILDNRQAAGLAMVCGGEQQILLLLLEASRENIELIRILASKNCLSEKIYIITSLTGIGPTFTHARMQLCNSNGQLIGLQSDDESEQRFKSIIEQKQSATQITIGNHSYFIEVHESRSSMYIFGAGHVARPTVAIAAMLDFQTVVVDDRREFANNIFFPQADKTVIIPNFVDPFVDLVIDKESFIVIVTRGHSHDQLVLARALRTPASYIGMIGSRRKVRTCFHTLKSQGWGDADLARVHAPIGIKIGAETPEEIAVSILAEMIQVRDQLRGK